MTGAQRVGRLGDVVAEPADDRDVALVPDQGTRPAGQVGEIGRDPVRADEVTLHGGGEARDDDRDVPGVVDVSDRNGDRGGATGDVERQQLAGAPVGLGEDLPGGPDRRQLGRGLLGGNASSSATEGPDGHRAGQPAVCAEQVAPGLLPGLEGAGLHAQGHVRPLEEDPVGAVAGPAGQSVRRADDLRQVYDRRLPLRRRQAVPPGADIGAQWRVRNGGEQRGSAGER